MEAGGKQGAGDGEGGPKKRQRVGEGTVAGSSGEKRGTGVCFRLNRDCGCTYGEACRFRHARGVCAGRHPASRCQVADRNWNGGGGDGTPGYGGQSGSGPGFWAGNREQLAWMEDNSAD